MKRLSLSMLVGLAMATTAAVAVADTEPLVDESYFAGPGGGDVSIDGGDGVPPLESSGLEDGIGGGCDCSLTGHPSAAPAAGLSLIVAFALFVVRRRRL
jgi:MYXO-CTERM domain-containing protein